MSISQDDLHPGAFAVLDDPTFDEEILFSDCMLGQEPFAPEIVNDLVQLGQNHDELFEAIQEMDKGFDPNSRAEDKLESLARAELEGSGLFENLSTLENPRAPSRDNRENHNQAPEPEHVVEHVEPALLKNQLLGGLVSAPDNVNPSLLLGGNIVGNPEAPHLHTPIPAAIPSEPSMLIPHPSISTPTAAPQHQYLLSGQTPVMDPARLKIGKKRKLHAHVEGGQMTPTGNHYVDVYGQAFNPGMFSEMISPSSLETTPTHSNGFGLNDDAQAPRPKRQRKAGLPAKPFPKPRDRPPKVPQRSGGQGQPSIDGKPRPKKRTRTRIEDMDPSMVHACTYQGCTKKFAKKYNLKIHQRRHNGDLPFHCEYAGCAKRFMWLSSFSRHIRVHEARRNGGRRRRDAQAQAEDEPSRASQEREPEIAISEDFAIVGVAGVKILVENEMPEDVTFARALTALDSRPCDSLLPVASIAQAKRRKLLSIGRAEEFYQQQATPYDVNNPQLQNFCQLLAVSEEHDGIIDALHPMFQL